MEDFEKDIKTAYLYDMDFEGKYHTVMLEKTDLINLGFLKNLKIEPCEDTLLFKGEIKQVSFINKEFLKRELARQNLIELKLQEQREELKDNLELCIKKLLETLSTQLEETTFNEYDFVSINNITNKNVINIYKYLYQINLNPIIKEVEDEYIVTVSQERIILSEKDISYLYEAGKLSEEVFILADYNKEDFSDEKCYGVNLIFRIKK